MALSKSYTVVGYSYEADVHCVPCTMRRFPPLSDGSRDLTGIDREGNEIHPIFLDNLSVTSCEHCGDCLDPLGDCICPSRAYV